MPMAMTGARTIGRRAMLALAAAALMAGLAATDAAHAQAPRLGRYEVRQAQFTSSTVLNILVLESAASYAVYDNLGKTLVGRGEYRFKPDPSSTESHFKWLSGPWQGRYGGTLHLDEGGRVHRIQLHVKTYAVNGG